MLFVVGVETGCQYGKAQQGRRFWLGRCTTTTSTRAYVRGDALLVCAPAPTVRSERQRDLLSAARCCGRHHWRSIYFGSGAQCAYTHPNGAWRSGIWSCVAGRAGLQCGAQVGGSSKSKSNSSASGQRQQATPTPTAPGPARFESARFDAPAPGDDEKGRRALAGAGQRSGQHGDFGR